MKEKLLVYFGIPLFIFLLASALNKSWQVGAGALMWTCIAFAIIVWRVELHPQKV